MSIYKAKIKLHDGAVFSYVTAITTSVEPISPAQQEATENLGHCPEWEKNTQFAVNFNNRLIAGNMGSGNELPIRYDVYRKKDGENWVKAGSVDAESSLEICDNAVCDNTEYQYSVYLIGESSESAGFSPVTIKTNWGKWTLLVADSTDTDNVFNLAEAFFFNEGLENVSISSNTTISQLITYGQYVRFQKDQIKSKSFSLSAFVGHMDCAEQRYVESASDFDAIFALSTDIRPKFLRDPQGHLWRVEVSEPVSATQERFASGGVTIKEVKVTEIASAEGSIIIGMIEV